MKIGAVLDEKPASRASAGSNPQTASEVPLPGAAIPEARRVAPQPDRPIHGQDDKVIVIHARSRAGFGERKLLKILVASLIIVGGSLILLSRWRDSQVVPSLAAVPAPIANPQHSSAIGSDPSPEATHGSAAVATRRSGVTKPIPSAPARGLIMLPARTFLLVDNATSTADELERSGGLPRVRIVPVPGSLRTLGVSDAPIVAYLDSGSEADQAALIEEISSEGGTGMFRLSYRYNEATGRFVYTVIGVNRASTSSLSRGEIDLLARTADPH